jgi:gluconokinase
MIVILFGVAGAGKTAVGRLLAAELGWEFHDADDFHAPASVEKMRRGLPLSEEDRAPWLGRLAELIASRVERGADAVIACSALKESHRRRLKCGDAVRLVHLKGDYALIERRLRGRRGHFMPALLLRSQFDALEEPEGGVLVIDVTPPPGEVVRAVRAGLGV